MPLLPPLAEMATVIAHALTEALKIVTPLVSIAADAFGLISDNFLVTAVSATAVGVALYALAAAMGVNTGATMLAAIAGVRLKETFIALRAVMVAHPILTIATILAVVTGAFMALDDSAAETASTLSQDIVGAFAEVENSGEAVNGRLQNIGRDLKQLTAQTVVADTAWYDMMGTLGKLDQMNWDTMKAFPDPEAVDAWLESVEALDQHLADLAESGMSNAEIMRYLNDELGISSEQYEELKPQLDDFLAAQILAGEETRELADAHGAATAALHGYGEELKAQTDPYFGLIKAQNDYNDALEKYNEVLNDPEASESDRAAAALALGESLTGLRIAADEAGTQLGEKLPEDFIAMAEASGVPQSAIEMLEDSYSNASDGIVSANDKMVASSTTAAAQAAEQLGFLSGATAEKAALIAESLQSVAANNGDVSAAFDEMARRSGMSEQGVVDAMIAMREAGFDFSTEIDAYLDAAGGSATDMANKTDGAASQFAGAMGRSGSAVENFARRNGTAQGSVRAQTQQSESLIDRLFSDIDDIVNNTGGTFQTLARTITGAMGSARTTVRSAFQTIRASIQKPVNFVVGTLYNDGIKPFWNNTVGALMPGAKKLGTIEGFAGGGFIRGPGTGTSDSIHAKLSNGEFVMRKKAVDAIGVNNLYKMNNLEMPAFAGGGLVGLIGKGASKAFDWLNDNAKPDWMSGLTDIMSSVGNIVDGLKTKFTKIPFDQNSKQYRDNLAGGAKRVWNQISKLWDSITGASGGMGGGPGDYRAMGEWIKSAMSGVIITSGKRNGTGTSYHNVGKAIDMAFTDGSEFRGGGKAEQAYNLIKKTWMASILELIWDFSPDGPSRGVKNGQMHTYTGGSAGPGTHADHIHWANEGAGGGGFAGGGQQGSGVQRWAGVASSVLSTLGINSASNLAAVLECIRQESSGRPDLQNNWDINAKNGIPSKGLMQVIPPTFASYAGKYKSRGIWDPFANIYAAVQYARSRYGGGWQRAITAPGGYAGGGLVKPLLFDSGGMLPTGVSVVENRTGAPEPLRRDNGSGGTTVNIDMRGSIVADDRQFSAMVAKALDGLSRKGGLRNIKINSKK
jgi:hypothetical protein